MCVYAAFSLPTAAVKVLSNFRHWLLDLKKICVGFLFVFCGFFVCLSIYLYIYICSVMFVVLVFVFCENLFQIPSNCGR